MKFVYRFKGINNKVTLTTEKPTVTPYFAVNYDGQNYYKTLYDNSTGDAPGYHCNIYTNDNIYSIVKPVATLGFVAPVRNYVIPIGTPCEVEFTNPMGITLKAGSKNTYTTRFNTSFDSPYKVTVTALSVGEKVLDITATESEERTTQFARHCFWSYDPNNPFVCINENRSLADIQTIIRNGQASQYFKVGDYIKFKFKNTDSPFTYKPSTSQTFRAVIIGIDHNPTFEGTNRVHFMIGEDNTRGYHIRFGTIKFNTDISSNAGGWEASNVRKQLNGAFLATLPDDLQAVISPVTKYTNNVGLSTGYNVASSYTPTTDNIFALSRYEQVGTGAGETAARGFGWYTYFKDLYPGLYTLPWKSSNLDTIGNESIEMASTRSPGDTNSTIFYDSNWRVKKQMTYANSFWKPCFTIA